MRNWDKKTIDQLFDLLNLSFLKFRERHKTDRQNLSALWNKHLGDFGISCVRPNNPKGAVVVTLRDFIALINHRNSDVSDAVCVANPDRQGQFLLVPRDIASKIIVLGGLP